MVPEKKMIKMNNSPLHFQLLEALLFIKNYVAGDPACKY